MKKYLSLFLVICLTSVFLVPFAKADPTIDNAIVMYVDSSTALVNNTEVYIDEDKSVVPIVEYGRTLVPVRFVAESLYMDVSYNQSQQIVTITNKDYNISFKIGNNTMTVNGAERMIDGDNPNVVAKILNDRTFIPMRSMAEAVNKKVFYDRGLIIISDTENIYNTNTQRTELDKLITKVNVLPVVGTAEYMAELLREYGGGGYGYADMAIGFGRAAMGITSAESAPASDKSTGYSETNVQVQGVDEADIVKTDGEYLYQVNNQSIVITKIDPVSQMSVTSVIRRHNEEFYPSDIFIDNNKLTVIAQVYKYNQPHIYDSANELSRMPPSYRNTVYTQCTVYDISDRSRPVVERTLEIEGDYLSSRKIDNIVYLVTNKYLSYGRTAEFASEYIDNNNSLRIGYDRVRYFPGFQSLNYLTVSSVDISQPNKQAVVETMLGGGQTIYVSRDNLYVATSNYSARGYSTTIVYKFSLNNGGITFLKRAEVRGNVLNQFSMDEYEGYFRIATTSYERQEQNNLYILDDTMNPCGSIEGIAPGERIYSARFVGDRGYMVTFKQVDPLFVIDLLNPYNPRILGNLKIPGYSDYIHPIDDNYILGFGKDATEEGFDKGMKMAMFDVSDVENPIQKFEEIIGDRGTESALLRNHRALLYAPQMNLLAFPITVREALENDKKMNAYGQLTFSGAYIYNFDTYNGFSLKGKISHLTDEDMMKMGNYADNSLEISRILYVGSSLITTSNSKVQAHHIDSLELLNGIDLPTNY